MQELVHDGQDGHYSGVCLQVLGIPAQQGVWPLVCCSWHLESHTELFHECNLGRTPRLEHEAALPSTMSETEPFFCTLRTTSSFELSSGGATSALQTVSWYYDGQDGHRPGIGLEVLSISAGKSRAAW